jgi:hypothetical protein
LIIHELDNQMLKTLCLSLLLLLTFSASAQSPDPAAQKMLSDQEYCYSLAAMANLTVLWRNSGRTLDEQLERRKKLLGADTPNYLLLQDIAKQVYENDIKDPKVAIADTHAACLEAKGHTKKFSQQAIRSCPVIGVMVGEVAMARKKGATVEQISALLGDRYGDLPKTYEGGIDNLAAKYSESSKPDAGTFDDLICMIRGMASQ